MPDDGIECVGRVTAVDIGIDAVFALQGRDVDGHRRPVIAVAVACGRPHLIGRRPAVIITHDGVDALVLIAVAAIITAIGGRQDAGHHRRRPAAVEWVRQPQSMPELMQDRVETQPARIESPAGRLRPAIAVARKYADPGIRRSGRVHKGQDVRGKVVGGDQFEFRAIRVGNLSKGQIDILRVDRQGLHDLLDFVGVPPERCLAVIGFAGLGEIDVNNASDRIELGAPVDRVGKQRPRPDSGSDGIAAIGGGAGAASGQIILA